MDMKKTLVVLAALAVITMFAAPTFASKQKGSVGTSDIQLDTVTLDDGTTVKLATGSIQPSLGSEVTFKTVIEPLAGWEYPMVAVTCYQDVNEDGTIDTSILGPDIVFSWLDKPDATVTLGGYSSIWTNRGGGDATCRADLDAYGWKGGKQSVRVLDRTDDFTALG
jgi:hypothetical protein